MAYHSARTRDPLLDDGMQAALEKRLKELLGLMLIAISLVLTAAMGSYVPNDPSWLSAGDAAPQNWLGLFGASVAAPLFIILGHGAWGGVLACAAWGLRMVFHQGANRFVGRSLFFPFLVALISIHAAGLVPGEGWTHSFGLGGLFGDTILGALVHIIPIDPLVAVKLVTIFSAAAICALGLFVFGVTRDELARAQTFLTEGIFSLHSIVTGSLFRIGGTAVAAGASRAGSLRMRMGARWSADIDPNMFSAIQSDPDPGLGIVPPMPPSRHAPLPSNFDAVPQEPIIPVSTPPMEAKMDIPDLGAAKQSLLARVAQRRKMLEARSTELTPEIIEPSGTHTSVKDVPEGPPVIGDRVQDRIARAIHERKARNAAEQQNDTARAEPTLSRETMPLFPEVDIPHFTTPLSHVAPLSEGDASQMVRSFVPAAPKAGFAASPLTRTQPESLVQHPARKPLQPSRQAQAEAQPPLQFETPPAPRYEIPPLSLLASASSVERHILSDESLEENARMLEAVLDDYGIKGEIVSVRPGPVVTMYELEPAPGLKASRVIGLADDIARSMSALSARVSTVPGRSVIGIELPNANREKVVLREILSARDFGDSTQNLPLALGKSIGGEPVVANLAKMPHLLIAGTTGSGKSVAINTMILSLLYKLTPDDCRLIMIDPKMLELSVYDGIPHLLSPVVTDPKKAVVALKWVVGEMEERYRKMSKMGVRNIEGYNSRVRDTLARGEMFKRTVQTGFDDGTGEPVFETEEIRPETLPYIVVIVDEMADLMMVAGKEIEACIQRLAQMARASGIHLIMATQRPSVDVITGTIKANFPTRISFQVTGKIDSRTILGEQGAEQLLGMGDMLFMAGGAKITRVHGPFVSDEEVEEIVTHLKSYGPPDYVETVLSGPEEDEAGNIDAVLGLGGNTDGEDALYDQAVAVVIKDRKCSTSYIQRKLAIGYNKAARLVEQMEEENLVSAANHVGKREILIPEQ